jgi:hypothetical protein
VIEKNPSGVLYECSTETCHQRTYSPNSDEPAERWAIDVKVYVDEFGEMQFADGDTPVNEIKLLNFCPKCIAQNMPVDVETFRSIAKTEKWVEENTRL